MANAAAAAAAVSMLEPWRRRMRQPVSPAGWGTLQHGAGVAPDGAGPARAGRRVARLLRAALLLLALPCLHASALEIVDDRGVRITLAQPPQRIVSALPSLTETVCALGRCDHLVGVDRYSNYPERVRRLPRIGGGLDPSAEAIVALRPDLVLLATSSPVARRLESLGLTVLALEPKRYADAQRVMLLLGQVLGVPDAPALWTAIEDGVDAAARALPAAARGKRIYFEVNSGPYAASASSFLGETLTRLGLANIVPGEMGPFPRINPEFVVRADPDLIMVGDATFVGMAQRPGWQAMRAIATGRVCIFTPAQADIMVRAGPRMADAARTIAQCVQRHFP